MVQAQDHHTDKDDRYADVFGGAYGFTQKRFENSYA
jgi:hypothetical protein